MRAAPPHKLIDRSRALGERCDLVLFGGGNTSAKVGRGPDRILWVKATGCDLASIDSAGFVGLKLSTLLELQDESYVEDADVVTTCEAARCGGSGRPSVETLLHAFLRAGHIDHVHADAICVLAGQPNLEEVVEAALGPRFGCVRYARPGFPLARLIADAVAEGHHGVVLACHGLICWGATSDESLDRTLSAVRAAETFAGMRAKRSERPPIQSHATYGTVTALRNIAERAGYVIAIDRRQREIADRPDARLIAIGGRATPDHLPFIGSESLFLSSNDDVAIAIDAYLSRRQTALASTVSPHDCGFPRAALVEEVGGVGIGRTRAEAERRAIVARHSHLVVATARDRFGRYVWLDEREIREFEEWPLERSRLSEQNQRTP